jgi:predicted nucleic acid-binding protein
LIPAINHKRKDKLKDLLLSLTKNPININWNQIIYMQTVNLRNGINKVGIADLIIAQNAIDNNLELYTLDKHFSFLNDLHGLKIYKP